MAVIDGFSFAAKYGNKDANNPFGPNSKQHGKVKESLAEAQNNVAHIVSDADKNTGTVNLSDDFKKETLKGTGLEDMDIGNDPDLIEIEALISKAQTLEELDMLLNELAEQLSSMDPEIVALKTEKEKEKLMKMVIALEAMQKHISALEKSGVDMKTPLDKTMKSELLGAIREHVETKITAMREAGMMTPEKMMSSLQSVLNDLGAVMQASGKNFDFDISKNAGNGVDITKAIENILQKHGINPEVLQNIAQQVQSQIEVQQQLINQQITQNPVEMQNQVVPDRVAQVNQEVVRDNVVDLAARLATNQAQVDVVKGDVGYIQMNMPANSNIAIEQQQFTQPQTVSAMQAMANPSVVQPSVDMNYQAHTTSLGKSETENLSRCGNCSGDCSKCGGASKENTQEAALQASKTFEQNWGSVAEKGAEVCTIEQQRQAVSFREQTEQSLKNSLHEQQLGFSAVAAIQERTLSPTGEANINHSRSIAEMSMQIC